MKLIGGLAEAYSFGNYDDPVKRSGLRGPEKTLLELSIPCQYRQGVLIGNWAEDRFQCNETSKEPFLPPPIKLRVNDKIHCTDVYFESRQALRVNKSRSHFGDIVNVLSETEAIGNFVTTNDLIYNHLPKQLCDPNLKDKIHHPLPPPHNLLKRYPNLTHWGLRKFKKDEWDSQKESDCITTLYDDTYTAPSQNQYIQPTERKNRNSSFTKSFNISKR